MSARDLVALVHLVGFATGIALYGMLAVMTWRSARRGAADAQGRIPLLAAVLGLLWNASALMVFGWRDFGRGELSPWFTALAYSALGFLPAVVVDSATRTPAPQRTSRPGRLALFAYGLSAIGGVLQAVAVVRGGGVSTAGLLTLTLGYAVVILIFALSARRRRESPKTLAAVALAAFAVSALHLSHHSSANESWVVELIGHHASLPLVLVILYQDYRFALADIFLKRAVAILLLVGVVLAAYALVVAPMLTANAASLPIGLPAVLLAGWIGTALTYPILQRGVDRFIDRVVLGRADYREVRAALVDELSAAGTVDEALDRGCECAQSALGGYAVDWRVDD